MGMTNCAIGMQTASSTSSDLPVTILAAITSRQSPLPSPRPGTSCTSTSPITHILTTNTYPQPPPVLPLDTQIPSTPNFPCQPVPLASADRSNPAMRAAANHFVAGTLAWLVVVNCYGDGGVVHADNVLVRPWGENALRVQVSPSSWTLTDALPTAYLPGGAPGDGFFTFGPAGHDVAGGPVTSGNIMAAQGEAQGEMWADREMGGRVRGWGKGAGVGAG